MSWFLAYDRLGSAIACNQMETLEPGRLRLSDIRCEACTNDIIANENASMHLNRGGILSIEPSVYNLNRTLPSPPPPPYF